MSSLSAAQIKDMIENKYFGNVDNKFLESLMTHFNGDATLTIQTDDLSHIGADNIRRMFQDFFGAYQKIWHGEFRHVVDVEKQSGAVQFVATRDTFEGEHEVANNCNFFTFEDGKIQTITVYMSDQNPLV